jgi:CHASE3 domain sensor protein
LSWPVFAVIQLGVVTLGVIIASFLRNRELNRRYAQLAAASDEALAAIAEAKAKLQSDAHLVWLDERISALEGDDDTTSIQRLVLANELEENPEFSDHLSERLGAADSAQDALRAQWQEVRATSHVTASRLIQEYPLSHPIIVQLYDAFESLDAALDIEPPALPEPAELSDDHEAEAAQEVEHLRASKELLEKELDVLKRTLDANHATNEESAEQAEDLKALLQQFTKDSRDMMECIQNLEAENKTLREQLTSSESANDQDAPTEVAEENAA